MTQRLDPDCLFCKIVAGEIPAQKVLSTEQVTAFRDISPQAPTHVLLIPNTHTPKASETEDPEVFSTLMEAARSVAAQEGLEDYRLVINNGPGAGQTVFHLHMHLLGGRDFHWPPG